MPASAADAAHKDLKRKLTRIVRALEEKYGPHIYPEDMALLERLLFAMLAFRNPVTNARKAIRALKEAYADWNEVRAATVRQIEESLARERIDEPGPHAEVLRHLLQRVFDEVMKVDLDGLRTDGPEKARKTVARLAGALEPWEQQYLLVGAGVEEAPPLDPATDRVLERAGIFQPQDPPAKRRKLLESVIDANDALRFHHLMVEHGKRLCEEEEPYPGRCIRCPAQGECEHFRRKEVEKRNEERQMGGAKGGSAAAATASGRPTKGGKGAEAASRDGAKPLKAAASGGARRSRPGAADRRRGDEDE